MNLTKEVFVWVTDPKVIASIESNGLEDVLGGIGRRGDYYAYKFSLDAWRERQRLSTTDGDRDNG